MEKNIYLKDYLVSRLISEGKQVEGYREVYYQTNENLIYPYLDVDFYDKDVLSVVASSDHILTARYLEAKNVDAFDNNRLAFYYFYLRIWTLKYMNLLYPPIVEDPNFLKNLLEKVEPKSNIEQKVYNFYKKHLEKGTDFYHFFCYRNKQPYGQTLFTKPEELKDCLSPKLKYFDYDLFKRIDSHKIYNFFLISNILDWARNDENKLKIAADNLSRLLKKDGTVICHKLVDRKKEDFAKENEIFSQDFYYEKKDSGYLYIKK